MLRRPLGLVVLALALTVPAQAQYFRFGKNKVQYDAHQWHYMESKHFDIYYHEGGEYLADYTAKAAEEAYWQVARLFQHTIADRIPIIVYQSHNEFAVTNAVDLPTFSDGIGGVTELFKNRVALPFTGDYREYRRVLHHELVHAVINDMFYGGSLQSIIQNNIQLHIPLWFNEGLAEYAALGWDTNSDMFVREAVLEDHLAPIEYLNGYFAYRGGQSVWDYIAEQYGREKVGEILQRLRVSRSVESSFLRATGLTLEDLSERWHRTLQEVYFPEVAAREDLDVIARPLITREEGLYNTSPALSPQGDKLAFISTKDGLFDVYLADASDGTILQKLVEGQTNPDFESLRILTPGLTWSPDGQQIALAVKSGPSDAIAVIDIQGGRTTHYRIPGVDQIITVAWSPKGGQIAFEASVDAQSDIFVLDLVTRQTVNYTNDLFSDHEPAWSPDGRMLVFHSDRGSYTDLGRYQTTNFEMVEHDYSQHDLYALRLGDLGNETLRAERLTFDEIWDEEHARFGDDASRLVFVSDRNGIYNLYEKNLLTGTERPLTDLTMGVMQVSLSADGRRAAILSLDEGVPSIYLLKNPFRRRIEGVLKPNVWAQRVMQETREPAPALAVAGKTAREGNPFFRDATDGLAYQRTLDRTREALLAFHAPRNPEDQLDPRPVTHAYPPTVTGGETPTDTSRGVRVGFRDYEFGEGFEAARPADDFEGFPDPFSVRNNRNEDGSYKPRKYKLRFSPDLVYGTAGYDLFGVQGFTQMMFSDVLGNHRIIVATNLLIDLRNSDYIFGYDYLARRTDWHFQSFHLSRILADFTRDDPTYFRYRQYGTSLTARYPLDKFRRLDFELGIVGVNQADITDATEPDVSRTLLHPSLTFTRDVTVPGFLAPRSGHRMAVRVSGTPVTFGRDQLYFMTILGDARSYVSFGGGWYSFALRASGGVSLGPDAQLFYTAGAQNWINHRFDEDNGFPISDATDFVFAQPVMPLRGYDVNAHNGSRFGLVNAEFRFPLVAALLPGPLPILPLYNLQGTAFLDAGAIWGGPADSTGFDAGFDLFQQNDNGDRVFDDILVGTGFGLRSILLGYPLRLDFAWPFDGRQFGKRQVVFSVGFDF